MTALGFLLVGFGALTIWSGFDHVIVYDLLRSFLGAPVTKRDATGKVTQ